jgi:hypothetical protein
VRWLPKDLMKLIGGLVVSDENTTSSVTVALNTTKKVKGRSAEMRPGLALVYGRKIPRMMSFSSNVPRSIYLYAALDASYSFPRFLELPERALQLVAKFLTLYDLCCVELTCKAAMARLAHVYAFQFCRGVPLLPNMPILATDEDRVEWNKKCKKSMLRNTHFGGRYSQVHPRQVAHTATASFCLMQ